MMFLEDKKESFRGVFEKKNLPHHQTNGGHHGSSDQNARAWQLRDPEFTICKFVTKSHIRNNFIDQIKVFLYIFCHTRGDVYIFFSCRQYRGIAREKTTRILQMHCVLNLSALSIM
jgi:hypothetical protein